MRLILIALMASLLTACISTSVRSFNDTEYSTAKYKKIAINNSRLPAFLQREMDDKLPEAFKSLAVEATSLSRIIPPTRDTTTEETKSIIQQSGYDAILLVELLDDKSSSTSGGAITNLNANAYSYGNRSRVTGSAYTVPLQFVDGKTLLKVTLVDVRENRKVWVSDALVEADGTEFVGNPKHIASSSSEAIAKKLKEDGRI